MSKFKVLRFYLNYIFENEKIDIDYHHLIVKSNYFSIRSNGSFDFIISFNPLKSNDNLKSFEIKTFKNGEYCSYKDLNLDKDIIKNINSIDDFQLTLIIGRSFFDEFLTRTQDNLELIYKFIDGYQHV